MLGPSQPGGRGLVAAPPGRPGHLGAEHPSATLDALLFTGHAHALAGPPDPALAAFGHYTEEVGRRQVPRFSGRRRTSPAGCCAIWVRPRRSPTSTPLRWRSRKREGTAEVTIAALEDLAEQGLDDGDPDGARARLAEAAALLEGDLVFGWRLT